MHTARHQARLPAFSTPCGGPYLILNCTRPAYHPEQHGTAEWSRTFSFCPCRKSAFPSSPNTASCCASRQRRSPTANLSFMSAPPSAVLASCAPANQKGMEKRAKRMPPLASAPNVQVATKPFHRSAKPPVKRVSLDKRPLGGMVMSRREILRSRSTRVPAGLDTRPAGTKTYIII